MKPETVARLIDKVLTGIPFLGNFLNGKKSIIGLLGYVAVQVLYLLGKLDADSAMRANLYISLWSGVGIVHKGAKAVAP